MEQDNKVETSKTYTQEEYDNAIGGVKKRFETKIEKDYVSKETYEELNQKYNELQQINRQPKIEDTYLKLGGKKEAFNDFLTLNKDLYDASDKDLEKNIKDKQSKYSYMFNGENKKVINPANIFQQAPQNNALQEEYLVGKDSLGDLIINKKR